jgi:hypothetical protein
MKDRDAHKRARQVWETQSELLRLTCTDLQVATEHALLELSDLIAAMDTEGSAKAAATAGELLERMKRPAHG